MQQISSSGNLKPREGPCRADRVWFWRKARKHLAWKNNHLDIYKWKFASFWTQTLYIPLQVSYTSNTPTDFGLLLQNSHNSTGMTLQHVVSWGPLHPCRESFTFRVWHFVPMWTCDLMRLGIHRLRQSRDCTVLPCSLMKYKVSL